MKKTLLVALLCCGVATVFSQDSTQTQNMVTMSTQNAGTVPTLKITKAHYTVSGGILGAANFTDFAVKNNPQSFDYITKPGYSVGAWLNFPLGNAISFEPQVMYSSYRYVTNSSTRLLLNDGKVRYVSIPVLFKIHAGDKFAFTLGPQLDLTNSVEDKKFDTEKADFVKKSWALTGGIEIFPHGVVTIFGRYLHGITEMDNRGAPEQTTTEYRNQNIQAGVKIKLFGKKIPADSDGDGILDSKDKCPNVVGLTRYDGCPIPDTDNDGVNDELDQCPTVAGLVKYNGCPIPDTDKDGINDEQDKCPTVPGLAKYQGCPIPDTDKDGINDEEDKCPTQAGPASRNGCPVTDRDNDGVNDDEDRCPDVAGTKANNGCPEVPAIVTKTLQTAAQSVVFLTGSAKLSTKSNVPLNRIVAVLKENPTVKVKVDGHTDNVGNDDFNMKLSDNRAASVKAYLVSKGIDEERIVSEGFGETTPIADNGSAAGRANNRRVEIKVRY